MSNHKGFYMCVSVYTYIACICVCACVHVCMCACMRACVHVQCLFNLEISCRENVCVYM